MTEPQMQHSTSPERIGSASQHLPFDSSGTSEIDNLMEVSDSHAKDLPRSSANTWCVPLLFVLMGLGCMIATFRAVQLGAENAVLRSELEAARNMHTHTDSGTLLDVVFPLHSIKERLPSLAQLRNYDKIIVSGPQRSGTTFTADTLARLLQYTHLDENVAAELHNKSGEAIIKCERNCSWSKFLAASERIVAQRPQWSHELDNIAKSKYLSRASVLVVFMARNCLDAFRSQNRIMSKRGGWTCVAGRTSELQKYLDRSELQPFFDARDMICKVKQDVWLKYQRPRLMEFGVDTLTLDYESLAALAEFVPEHDRGNLAPKQIARSSQRQRNISR
eukprot:gb/GFBE01082477.1/.p1 GENE.gb/GFBE01082477.1/~~gb/GFBE01082477.1/.p1  ORF type:complete len:334 (+),score=40.24 gb/GFBE01082477.1/:1-1002(+)